MMIFAHHWVIDGVAIYLIPALFALVSLRWAERRARRAAEHEKEEATG